MKLNKNYSNKKFYEKLKSNGILYKICREIGFSESLYKNCETINSLSFSAYKCALYYLYNKNLYNKAYVKMFEKNKYNTKLVFCVCVDNLKKLGIDTQKAFGSTDVEISKKIKYGSDTNVRSALYALSVLYLVHPKLAKMDIATLESIVYKEEEENCVSNISNELNYRIMAALG